MTTAQLLQTYNSLPDSLKKEVEHYLEFLAQKVSSPENSVLESKVEYVKKERGGYGVLKGKIKMSDDFDAPLDEFKEYM